jgi:hypothetical protein
MPGPPGCFICLGFQRALRRPQGGRPTSLAPPTPFSLPPTRLRTTSRRAARCRGSAIRPHSHRRSWPQPLIQGCRSPIRAGFSLAVLTLLCKPCRSHPRWRCLFAARPGCAWLAAAGFFGQPDRGAFYPTGRSRRGADTSPYRFSVRQDSAGAIECRAGALAWVVDSSLPSFLSVLFLRPDIRGGGL